MNSNFPIQKSSSGDLSILVAVFGGASAKVKTGKLRASGSIKIPLAKAPRQSLFRSLLLMVLLFLPVEPQPGICALTDWQSPPVLTIPIPCPAFAHNRYGLACFQSRHRVLLINREPCMLRHNKTAQRVTIKRVRLPRVFVPRAVRITEYGRRNDDT